MDSSHEASERSDIERVAESLRMFLGDLAILRSANTVRAYAFDLDRWVDFCRQQEIDPFHAHQSRHQSKSPPGHASGSLAIGITA